jgi:hypothetical protein
VRARAGRRSAGDEAGEAGDRRDRGAARRLRGGRQRHARRVAAVSDSGGSRASPLRVKPTTISGRVGARRFGYLLAADDAWVPRRAGPGCRAVTIFFPEAGAFRAGRCRWRELSRSVCVADRWTLPLRAPTRQWVAPRGSKRNAARAQPYAFVTLPMTRGSRIKLTHMSARGCDRLRRRMTRQRTGCDSELTRVEVCSWERGFYAVTWCWVFGQVHGGPFRVRCGGHASGMENGVGMTHRASCNGFYCSR